MRTLSYDLRHWDGDSGSAGSSPRRRTYDPPLHGGQARRISSCSPCATLFITTHRSARENKPLYYSDLRNSDPSEKAEGRLSPISLFPIKQIRGGSVVKHISVPPVKKAPLRHRNPDIQFVVLDAVRPGTVTWLASRKYRAGVLAALHWLGSTWLCPVGDRL